MEVLWGIVSGALVFEILMLALRAEDVISSADRGSLAFHRGNIGSSLSVLHVVDAAVSDTLLLREIPQAAAHALGIEAFQRLLSQTVAGSLLLLLLSQDGVN